MDYKENVRLGGGLREIGKVFYTKTQNSVFGAIIYYNYENIMKKLHVN